ncbi:SMC-Scp complex subunit ScpB [Bifidobacterium saguinibicoloris]|uniref:SMC-Scp complex subunit ScpB n=1 Tax=Bifidobacterium saguinibicoloris TaxID=2834433 RepID=UPI001C5A1938|nr:SMC-Scp complex subunit ScpB [Bifidobacterium saguinibicoloris]MBW3079818.1 SMC-Scp complex subunit ScpB [Bifidobacterium saguinibicoloris]
MIDGRGRTENATASAAGNLAVEDFPGGLKACLEAVLMVTDRPLQTGELARVLGVGEPLVEEALERLADSYEVSRRGFELRRGVRGWRFASRAEYEPVVRAFVTDGQAARLSQAALEALAVIAYRQPVTRARVAAVRGVNSDGVIRSLAVRGLVREDGTDPETRAALLVTTDAFLEYMGLDSLGQLPSLAPFLPDVGEVIGDGV